MCLDHVTRGDCLGPKTMYLAKCTRSDIYLSLIGYIKFYYKQNILECYQTYPTVPKGMDDLGLFYRVGEDSNIKEYMDVGGLPLRSTSREITNMLCFP